MDACIVGPVAPCGGMDADLEAECFDLSDSGSEEGCRQLTLPEDDDGPPLHELMPAEATPLVLDGCASSTGLPLLPRWSAARAQCGCNANCSFKLERSPAIVDTRRMYSRLDRGDQQQWLFNQVLVMSGTLSGCDPEDPQDGDVKGTLSGCDPDDGDVKGTLSGCDLEDVKGTLSDCDPEDSGTKGLRVWSLGGHRVCFRGWCQLLRVGPRRVRNVVADVDAGRTVPRQDQRHYAAGRDPSGFSKVDAFLEFAYQHLAEPLADNVAGVELPDSEDSSLDMEDKGMQVLPGVQKEARYLGACSTKDFYDTYCHFAHGEAASESTFRRALKCWRNALKFRRVSQHAKCSTCARLHKLRKDATTAAERDAVRADLDKHLRAMFMDRAMDARYGKLSEESARGTVTTGTILSLAMDGMDQAKFKVPRNVCNAKELENLWRPVLHATGVLAEGVGEFYYLAEGDAKKNSDMNCQCLGRTLEKLNHWFKARLLVVPQHLVLLTDNTTREQKNQNVVAFLAWLVASGKFETVTNNFFRVGHTHMKLDQRFSVVAKALSAAQVLQTPQAFAAHVEQTVRYGRLCTDVEINTGAWNWQKWLRGLGVRLTGLAPTTRAPDVCHCWRFVRRRDLARHVSPGVEDLLVVPQEFASDPVTPNDCILLLKQWVCSTELSQEPLLVLPAARLDRLDPTDSIEPVPRNTLTDQARREYKKTAARFGDAPWNLTDAETYLREWVKRNEDGEKDSPGAVNFVLHGRPVSEESTEGPAILPLWGTFAPGPPRVVNVESPLTRPPGDNSVANVSTTSQVTLAGAAAPSGASPKPKAKPSPKGCAKGKAKAKAAAKQAAAAKPKVKAKAKSAAATPKTKAAPKKRAREDAADVPVLGCSKCRYAQKGCRECRAKRAKALNRRGVA